MAVNLIWDANTWVLRAKAESDETLFTWTYPMFEIWKDDVLLPSEYMFMVGYIENNIQMPDLMDIYRGDYKPGPLCKASVKAWCDLPDEEKADWHEQTVYQIEGHRELAMDREEQAISWLLEDDSNFEEKYSKIYPDVCKMFRGLVLEYSEKRKLCERLLAEEGQFV